MSNKLNGLPGNLVASFFGTGRSYKGGIVPRYYSGGYMADWLFNAAQKYNIKYATLDIKNGRVSPSELNIHPLLVNMEDLNSVIENELKANAFPADFITEARIEVVFKDIDLSRRISYFSSVVIDKEGAKYQADNILIGATETYFDVDDKLSEQNKK